MKVISLVFVLVILSGTSFVIEAKAPNSKSITKPNAAISRAVQQFTDKNSQDVGKVKISSSDIQGDWALIWAESVKKKLDPVQYLLHKEKGQWKVLVMGTDLVGTGKDYKVPNNLRRKWNL